MRQLSLSPSLTVSESPSRNWPGATDLAKADPLDGPHYITHPFKEEPGRGVASVNFSLKALLDLSTKP